METLISQMQTAEGVTESLKATDPAWTQRMNNIRVRAEEIVREDFNTLYAAMNGKTLREMDQIIYPVCTLCRDHKKTGVVNGI